MLIEFDGLTQSSKLLPVSVQTFVRLGLALSTHSISVPGQQGFRLLMGMGRQLKDTPVCDCFEGTAFWAPGVDVRDGLEVQDLESRNSWIFARRYHPFARCFSLFLALAYASQSL